jgi:hypothetical protein
VQGPLLLKRRSRRRREEKKKTKKKGSNVGQKRSRLVAAVVYSVVVEHVERSSRII